MTSTPPNASPSTPATSTSEHSSAPETKLAANINLIAKAFCYTFLFFTILAAWVGFGSMVKLYVLTDLKTTYCFHIGGLMAGIAVIDVFYLISQSRKP